MSKSNKLRWLPGCALIKSKSILPAGRHSLKRKAQKNEQT